MISYFWGIGRGGRHDSATPSLSLARTFADALRSQMEELASKLRELTLDPVRNRIIHAMYGGGVDSHRKVRDTISVAAPIHCPERIRFSARWITSALR